MNEKCINFSKLETEKDKATPTKTYEILDLDNLSPIYRENSNSSKVIIMQIYRVTILYQIFQIQLSGKDVIE